MDGVLQFDPAVFVDDERVVPHRGQPVRRDRAHQNAADPPVFDEKDRKDKVDQHAEQRPVHRLLEKPHRGTVFADREAQREGRRLDAQEDREGLRDDPALADPEPHEFVRAHREPHAGRASEERRDQIYRFINLIFI